MPNSTPDRTPQPRSQALSRACEYLSGAGIYLLPVFYVSFVAMLFLLWRSPAGAFWLPAAAGALGGSMGVWALVFHVASAKWSNSREPAATRPAAPLAATRSVPLRFVQMTTRTCSHACTSSSGARSQFTVSCFHAHCPAATPAKKAARPPYANSDKHQ
jgi:hypothetical protein